MGGIVAGLVLLGALCGAFLRLMPFVVILVGAAAIAAISAVLRGPAGALLDALFDAVVAVVALQVGYAAGIVIRAAWRSWRQARRGIGPHGEPGNVRVPTQEKPR